MAGWGRLGLGWLSSSHPAIARADSAQRAAVRRRLEHEVSARRQPHVRRARGRPLPAAAAAAEVARTRCARSPRGAVGATEGGRRCGGGGGGGVGGGIGGGRGVGVGGGDCGGPLGHEQPHLGRQIVEGLMG